MFENGDLFVFVVEFTNILLETHLALSQLVNLFFIMLYHLFAVNEFSLQLQLLGCHLVLALAVRCRHFLVALLLYRHPLFAIFLNRNHLLIIFF